MIKVKITRNYSYPDLFRQTPGGSAIWEDILFTEDDVDEADFIIVLNQPAKDINMTALKGGVWLFLQEPPYEKKSYFTYHFRFVDKVISGFSEEIANNINEQAGLPWHVDKSYDFLKQFKATDHPKQDRVSWITSNLNTVPGHEPRIKFIEYLRSTGFDFDLFGRGFEPIKDKFDGLAPYKYSIAVENYFANDYFTEKAIDCFLSWTMPVYYGCTNFDKYFPKGSYLCIDINKPEQATEIIKQAIEDKLWEKNIDAIAEARNLILDKYQLFPMVKERIMKFYEAHPDPQKRFYKIPKSGLTPFEEFKKKIKSKFFGKP